jgi:hypothetical protein
MSKELVQTLYEEGRTVAQIAKASRCKKSEVTALLAETENALDVRQEKYARQLRRVRALADSMTLEYLERLQTIIADTASTDKEKSNAFAEMDKVLRIAKLYSDRVLLAEGKTTENIGVNGQVGLPFSVVFTKTYEKADGTTNEHE